MTNSIGICILRLYRTVFRCNVLDRYECDTGGIISDLSDFEVPQNKGINRVLTTVVKFLRNFSPFKFCNLWNFTPRLPDRY